MWARSVEQSTRSEKTGVKDKYADSVRGTSRKVDVKARHEQSTIPDRASVTSQAARSAPLPRSREGDKTRPENNRRVEQHEESSDSDCFAKPVQSATARDSKGQAQHHQSPMSKSTAGAELQQDIWAHNTSTAIPPAKSEDEESHALKFTDNESSYITLTDDEQRKPSRQVRRMYKHMGLSEINNRLSDTHPREI